MNRTQRQRMFDPPRSARLQCALLAIALATAVSGCSPTYILRAGYEEARILWSREPIESVLAAADLPDDERAKLELVLAAREFAADEIGLRVGGSYATLAQVDDAAVVHVVSAAERFRLRSYTWWFPVVGRVPYKGYFELARAQQEAGRLEGLGYDTYVRPAGAFSTLGWFDDPLLSSLLELDGASLTNVVIHELLHSTSYTPGQAAFAESFATFVGYRGAIDFLRARGDDSSAQAIASEWTDTLAFSAYLDEAVRRIESAYERGVGIAERTLLFAQLQAQWAAIPQVTDRYAGFARRPLNNAVLLQLLLYHRELPLFETLWHAHGGDLAEMVRSVVAATESGGDAFATVRELCAAARCDAVDSGLERSQPIDAEAAGNNEGGDAQGSRRPE